MKVFVSTQIAPSWGKSLSAALIPGCLAALMLAGSAVPANGADAPPAAAGPKSAAAPAAAATSPAQVRSEGSYSLGVSMGEQLRRAGLTTDTLEVERLTNGLRDGFSGKAQMGPADQQHISALAHEAREASAQTNHTAARTFLAANKKKKDIHTTASGLQYQVVTAGSGASPSANDQVTVNYRGALLNGTEFDSSYKRGQPATFPVKGVIKGWQEALVLMKPGAKWKLFIPPDLAYDVDSPPAIPPGSMLVFDVELLSVKKSGATPTPASPN